MWAGEPKSRRRCGRGEPHPCAIRATARGALPRAVVCALVQPFGQLPARHAVAKPRASPPSAVANRCPRRNVRPVGRRERLIALQMVAPPHLTPAEREVPMHAARHAAALCTRRATRRLYACGAPCSGLHLFIAAVTPRGGARRVQGRQRRACHRVDTAAVVFIRPPSAAPAAEPARGAVGLAFVDHGMHGGCHGRCMLHRPLCHG